MRKISKRKIGNGGYAILELLFYIVFFALLTLVVINAMITMTRSFRETSLQREFAQGGVLMERISRGIRQAYSINSISATDLKLNIKDSLGVTKTEEFLLSGSNVRFLENNVLTGNLNTGSIIVTDLAFTQITTIMGKAIKVSLTFRSSNDASNRLINFYNTVVLRGDY